jgi:hypothetical protein
VRALILVALAACGSASKPAATGEELLATWLPVKLGEPPGERPGFERTGDLLLEATPDRATELNLEAGRVVEVAIEWRGDAARAAEQKIRERLPPPRECAGAHREIAEFKPLLWQLADGTSVSAIRKGSTYRLSVRRPATEAFVSTYATCVAP